MKIAFTGKGGVGKTTLAGLFIRALSMEGTEVLAVDCDPDSNFGRVLGFESADKITPIIQMEEMINERMGVEKGKKSFYKLNPKIDDIPERFSKTRDNVKLIVMGAVKRGGSGCMCPENSFIKNLLNHIVLNTGEHIVMDMEAGLEHFGRGTAGSCDFVLAVVEPSVNSIQTAKNINKLAANLKIKKVYALGNKVRGPQDVDFIKKELGEIKLIGAIDFDESILLRDKEKNVSSVSEKTMEKIIRLKKVLEEDSN